MKDVLDTSTMPITFAPVGFKWHEEDAEGLPIIHEVDGSVCEPLLRYFGWSLRYNRVAVSSMRDEAYTLREWWLYLRSSGVPWNKVDDLVLSMWREAQKTQTDGKEDEVRSLNRVNRKIETVFTFYDRLRSTNLCEEDIVGTLGPITCREREERAKFLGSKIGPRQARTWASAKKGSGPSPRRPTPTDSAVDAVLAKLRSSSADVAVGDRNWLIGRVMAEAGLRGEEVADLSVRGLGPVDIVLEPDA